MKWLLTALCCVSAALVTAGALGFVYLNETKPYIDLYANHFSVLGFFVSVVGFILTVAVFETLRVSKKAQGESRRWPVKPERKPENCLPRFDSK